MLDVPKDRAFDDAELAAYLKTAIEALGGRFAPDDPLCGTVRVKNVKIGGIVYE
jgi:hypothetical protein